MSSIKSGIGIGGWEGVEEDDRYHYAVVDAFPSQTGGYWYKVHYRTLTLRAALKKARLRRGPSLILRSARPIGEGPSYARYVIPREIQECRVGDPIPGREPFGEIYLRKRPWRPFCNPLIPDSIALSIEEVAGTVSGLVDDPQFWNGWRTMGDTWAFRHLVAAINGGASRVGSAEVIRQADMVLGVDHGVEGS